MKLFVSRRPTALAALSAALFFPSACARVPDADLGETGKRVVVRFRVANQIQPPNAARPYYYFFVFNRSDNATDPGPVPRTSVPWGNGFVASSQSGRVGYIGIVQYESSQSQGLSGYQVYSIATNDQGEPVGNPDEFLALPDRFNPIGAPDVAPTPQQGANELYFELNLDRLPRSNQRYLQFNIITTDNLPAGADLSVVKDFDSLGSGLGGIGGGGLNVYGTIDATVNNVVTNAQNLGNTAEPQGDVINVATGALLNEPNLDIIDWSVEIKDAR